MFSICFTLVCLNFINEAIKTTVKTEEGSEKLSNFFLFLKTYRIFYICFHNADVAYHNLLIATFWFVFCYNVLFYNVCVYIYIY